MSKNTYGEGNDNWGTAFIACAALIIGLLAGALLNAPSGPPQKTVTVYHRVNYTSWRLEQESKALANCFSIFGDNDGSSSGTYVYCLKHVRQEFSK